jgi:hypothetical protein
MWVSDCWGQPTNGLARIKLLRVRPSSENKEDPYSRSRPVSSLSELISNEAFPTRRWLMLSLFKLFLRLFGVGFDILIDCLAVPGLRYLGFSKSRPKPRAHNPTYKITLSVAI